MKNVLELTLGFGLGQLLYSFAMSGIVAARYAIHRRKRGEKEVDVEEMMAAFRRAYMEDEDAQHSQPSDSE